MQVFIHNPIEQTLLFSILLGSSALLTLAKKTNYTPLSLTRELKGFAILAIIFAHIGYYLSTDSRFLFPLSILAGVGVNLFLFLSGYGLTFSHLHKEGTVMQFYMKRLPKLFVPFWMVVSLLFIGSFFLHGAIYSGEYVAEAMVGVFRHANLYTDINSPLWYFTLILFYYVLFPIVFVRRHAWITAMVLYGTLWFLVKMDLPSLRPVIGLYQVHMMAFPLGILVAWYLKTPRKLWSAVKNTYTQQERFLYPVSLLALSTLIGYLAFHAHVQGPAYIEETISLCTMFPIMAVFLLKKRESKLLSVFGFFSYEIYLFHWPLMYQYDFLYTRLPAWLATFLYLGLFILLGYVFKRLSDLIFRTLLAPTTRAGHLTQQ